MFRCRHQRIDAVISWQVNGSSFRLYHDVVDNFVRDGNGTHVDTLTIPAIPVYNRSEVVCIAAFFDGSPLEVTPSATLIITGALANEVYIFLKQRNNIEFCSPYPAPYPHPTSFLFFLTQRHVVFSR